MTKLADTLMTSIDSAVSVLENSDAIHLTYQIFSLLGLADASSKPNASPAPSSRIYVQN